MKVFVLLLIFGIKYGSASSEPHIDPLPLTCDGFRCDIGSCELRPSVSCVKEPCPQVPTCTKEHQVKPALAVSNALPCGQNEEFKVCGSSCENTCERNCFPLSNCSPNVCRCKVGFVRKDGICIQKIDCTAAASCPRNETFDSCGGCERKCGDPAMMNCAMICRPGKCVCSLGFVRNQQGICIQERDCTGQQTTTTTQATSTCSRANEEFKTCGSRCEPSCNRTMPICTQECVVNVCQCKIGFYRSNSGECVLINQCAAKPSCATENEELKECGSRCEPACNNTNPICTMDCLPNVCQCKVGLYRNTNGHCVPLGRCSAVPTCTRPNEEFKTCGTRCEPTCNNSNPICTMDCVPNVCQCLAGFVRNGNGDCVRSTECSNSNTCKPSEVLKPCGSACVPSCANPTPICTEQCIVNVCQCAPGYYRNQAGSCVALAYCDSGSSTVSPRVCKTNETFKNCGTACEPSCANPTPICNKQCVPNVCQCSVGFVRNGNGDCVKANECINSNTCKPSEVLRPCGSACEPSCANTTPICTEQCIVNVCQCAPGYYRNQAGSCVALAYCDSGSSTVAPHPICKINEEYTNCGSACEPTCNTPMPICTKQCVVNVCQCKAGFVRSNVNGTCIQQNSCPSEISCKTHLNEEFKECGSACEPTCSQLNSDTKAKIICPAVCINNACQCKMGFYRNSTGGCVEEKQCEKTNSTCVGQNEELKGCGTMCEPTCSDKTPICNHACKVNVCQCKQGFVRNSKGDCIAETQCPAVITCANIRCSSGKVCKMVDVVCKKAPCPTRPECVDPDHPISTCTNVKCSSGNSCAMVQNAICSSPPCVAQPRCINDTALSCNTMECTTGNNCEYFEVQCITAPCYPQPRCVPKPVRTCANTECSAGKICKEVQVNCLIAPCPPSQPICVDQETKTCLNVRCTAGTYCEMVEQSCNNPPCSRTPRCLNSSLPTCASTSCSAGQECKMVEVQCIKALCDPQPRCVSSTPVKTCANTECAAGKVCKEVQVNCLIAPCPPAEPICVDQKTNTCLNVRCTAGTFCEMVEQSCNVPPCSPIPRCLNTSLPTCASTSCISGQECRMVDVQCIRAPCDPQPKCVSSTPVRTCANTECAAGKVCKEVQVNCLVAPCPPSQPICVDQETNTCLNVRCTAGTFCEMVEQSCNNPPCSRTPRCLSSSLPTCASTSCFAGQECKMVEVQCIKAPCEPIPVCAAPSIQRCRQNETFDNCGGCEQSCGESGNKFCPAICRPGACVCAVGFLRNSSAICVKQADCNQVVDLCRTTKCAAGQKCILTEARCIAPPCMKLPTCVPEVADPSTPSCATVKCISGMHCAMKKVNCMTEPCTLTPICVKTDECGINEEYVQCRCDQTCRQALHKCETCSAGCQCAQGFLRNQNGNCIRRDQCVFDNPNPVISVPCRFNETFNQCPSQIERSCSNFNISLSAVCAVPRCTCFTGYVRNDEGKCIWEQECPGRKDDVNPISNKNCGKNQIYSQCPTVNELTCANLDSAISATCGVPRCTCIPGYARNSSGECIGTEDCGKKE